MSSSLLSSTHMLLLALLYPPLHLLWILYNEDRHSSEHKLEILTAVAVAIVSYYVVIK
jgi:hypothetical protein